MSHVLLIGCDPADEAILESNLRQARHQTHVHDALEGGIDQVLARPWDAVVTPSRGPAGAFADDLAKRLSSLVWRPLATVLVYESPIQEPEAGIDAMTCGADLFVDRGHIEALIPALQSGLRGKRRMAEQVERVRQGALRVQRLRQAESQPAGVATDRHCVPGYGCILVGLGGDILGSDSRAAQLLGRELRGAHLEDVAPDGALMAPFRAAQVTAQIGDTFDVLTSEPSGVRRLRSTCIPARGDNGQVAIVLVHEVPASQQAGTPTNARLPASWVQSVTRVRRSMGASRIQAASRAGAKLRSRVRECAVVRNPLGLVGEPGVMRSHIARCVHYENPMGGVFHEVRSQAFSPRGLEAELFGVGGAVGRLEPADTLLVTHLDSVPADLQRRLCQSLSGTGPDPLAARLMVSAPKGYEGVVAELQSHLEGSTLVVPSLRERPEDMPALAREALAGLTSLRPIPTVDEGAIAALRVAHLPGNFDDLEEALRVALAVSGGSTIGSDSLPQDVLQPVEPGGSEWCQAPWSITDADPICFEVYERKAIQRALASCRGDKVAAAQMLAVGRSTLYRKLRSLGLEA